MEQNKLTITIPSYKQPEELRRALTALSYQTFKNFKVIIIDDQSGIDLFPIVDEFKKKLSIDIHINKKNLGAMKNLEFSINFPCDSEFILSHHEDDFLASNYLEQAINILETEKDVAFVVAAPVWIKREQGFILKKIPETIPRIYSAREFMEASLSMTPFIFGSIIYRREKLFGNFEIDMYYTLCDKIYLNNILLKSSSCAAFINKGSIYVTNHSLDEKDIRSTNAKETHLINYFLFYKNNLPKTLATKKLITNGLLFGFIYLPGKHDFITFIKKALEKKLISLYAINLVGLYSLFVILFKKTNMLAILKTKR